MRAVPALGLALALVLGPGPSPAAAQDRFRVEGTTLVFDTETGEDRSGIARTDVESMIEMLRAIEGITTIRLHSVGGGYYPAFDMARAIVDFDLDTEIVDECSSACAYVFLGGKARRMAKGARLGFHRTWWEPASISGYYEDRREDRNWQTPFDFAAWNYEDTQVEIYERLRFMVDRGVAADFAIETLRAGSTDMWYPWRLRLLAAGVLTE